MTLSCNCDMPIEIYCDWLQDQGWDTDELREMEDIILTDSKYFNGIGCLYNAFGCQAAGEGHFWTSFNGDGVWYDGGNGYWGTEAYGPNRSDTAGNAI